MAYRRLSIINNQAIVESGLLGAVDPYDMIIYDFIHDFIARGAAVTHIVNGVPYYWVSTKLIVQQLPLLCGMSERNIKRKVAHLIEVGLLESASEEICKSMRMSLYRIGPKGTSLSMKEEDDTPKGDYDKSVIVMTNEAKVPQNAGGDYDKSVNDTMTNLSQSTTLYSSDTQRIVVDTGNEKEISLPPFGSERAKEKASFSLTNPPQEGGEILSEEEEKVENKAPLTEKEIHLEAHKERILKNLPPYDEIRNYPYSPKKQRDNSPAEIRAAWIAEIRAATNDTYLTFLEWFLVNSGFTRINTQRYMPFTEKEYTAFSERARKRYRPVFSARGIELYDRIMDTFNELEEYDKWYQYKSLRGVLEKWIARSLYK